MLKQEPPEEQTAARIRVTPEELAAAVTALQIRKEGQPGTIAIGDAVDELGLDVTPDEVLAEVQARRQTAPKKKRQLRSQRFVLALGIAGILLGLALERNGLVQMQGRQAASSHTAGSSLTLDQVTDNQQFYVNERGLEQIVSGDTPASIHVDHRVMPNSTYAASDWRLIKHGEKVYVQAYAVQTFEKQLRSGQTIDLYNTEDISLAQHPDIGPRLLVNGVYHTSSHVTLPISNCILSDSEQMDTKARITIETQPDSHLWDNQ